MNLMTMRSDKYQFATAEQITCLGMNIDAGQLYEWIGDHTKKIIEENERQLMKVQGTGSTYTVSLREQEP